MPGSETHRPEERLERIDLPSLISEELGTSRSEARRLINAGAVVTARVFGDEAPTMVAERLWAARLSGTQEDLPGWDEFTDEERASKVDNARNLLLAALFPEDRLSSYAQKEEG